VLAPNALRLLDSMGVYDEIRDQGLKADQMYFKNAAGDITGTFYMGHERVYGYKCLRILRRKLMDTLLKKVEEKNIPIVIKRFTSLLEENEKGVVLQFEDGSTEKADLVVGADGIHSTVRDLITTNEASEPTYTGHVGLNSVVETQKIRIPDDWEMPCITISKLGGFIMAPHDATGEGIFLATQAAVPEQDKEGWKAMKDNHEYLKGLLQQDMKIWPDVVQSALENIEDDITLWPFYVVPKLKNWATSTGRVVIVGDAAHAIPPTIGQGMNQGLEDGYLLALILANTSADISLPEAVAFWQRYRQARVDQIVELCRIFTNSILPKHIQDKMDPSDIWRQEHPENVEQELEKLMWLYAPRLDEEVMEWVRTKELDAKAAALGLEENECVMVKTNEMALEISV
jgi:2-polyprenyl-6-methoxyphenol hydroxylase-like FAD-dependent oxidoreductase